MISFLRRLRQLFILFIIYFSKHARGIFPHSWWNICRLWRMSPPTVMCSSAASWMKSAESFSVSISPPAMEGFLRISIQKCTAMPRHQVAPITEIRNYYLFSSYSFSLFSIRKSYTPPLIGGFISAHQKTGGPKAAHSLDSVSYTRACEADTYLRPQDPSA